MTQLINSKYLVISYTSKTFQPNCVREFLFLPTCSSNSLTILHYEIIITYIVNTINKNNYKTLEVHNTSSFFWLKSMQEFTKKVAYGKKSQKYLVSYVLPYPTQKLPQTIFCPIFFLLCNVLRLYKLGCKWLTALLTKKETRLKDPR